MIIMHRLFAALFGLLFLSLVMAIAAHAVSVSKNLTITVTSSSSGSVPQVAANAGFNTLAANYDFSQSQYANQSSWLDCSGTNTSFVWHRVHTGLPCNAINQGIDPATGDTVLDFHWLQSYSSFSQSGNDNFAEIDTATTDSSGNVTTPDFPINAYVETLMRNTAWTAGIPSGGSSGPDGIWTWSHAGAHFEIDFDETFGQSPSGVHAAIPWGGAGNYSCSWDTGNYLCSNARIPSGFRMDNYHKYGSLITGNGSTGSNNMFLCSWIDDVFQGCQDMSPSSSEVTSSRNWIKMWIGGGNNPVPDKDMYVKYVRVWTCNNWNGSSPANQCNGLTFSQSTVNGTNLSYWH